MNGERRMLPRPICVAAVHRMAAAVQVLRLALLAENRRKALCRQRARAWHSLNHATLNTLPRMVSGAPATRVMRPASRAVPAAPHAMLSNHTEPR